MCELRGLILFSSVTVTSKLKCKLSSALELNRFDLETRATELYKLFNS